MSAQSITRSADRQRCLASGGSIVQETRHFHENDGSTTSGRIKEESEDYRYFPEPDLVPVAPSDEWVDELRATLPEPPLQRRQRLRDEWGISDHDMQSLVNAGGVELVERTIELGADQASARKWWTGEIARVANERSIDLAEVPITPADVARVVEIVASGALNDKLARQVIEGVIEGEGTPDEVVAARGLQVVSDDGALLAAIDEALGRLTRRRRQDQKRQDASSRRHRRRCHESHARSGGRSPGPRTHS